MKSYRELTGRYLKNQRKRSILTIVGIILSVSLLCAAGIMGESFKNMLKENVKQNYGNYHVAYRGLDESQIAKLQNNIKVEKVGYKINAGLDQITPTQNLAITGCNKEYLDMLYIGLSSGKLPEKDNEIVLEQWILDNMKVKPAIGDMVRLDFNIQGIPNGKDNTNREFKLTGIFKNVSRSQYSGLSIAAVTVNTAKSILNDQQAKMDAFIIIKDKLPMQAAIGEITGSIGAKPEQVHQNTAVLSTIGQGNNNQANNAILIVQTILILVIIISTIAVIYNAFHISVLERIHQFGVMRSVGTTPRQIRAIVLGEALVLGVIGIPLGLMFGILAMEAVIGIFSMQSSAFFGSMQVVIPLRTILITAVLGFVTLLASAFGPAVSASRVSPMEAILNNSRANKGKIKKRKHPILSRLLRVEGVMAYDNLRRNRKRFFVTVFSMCIGIVLFIFFSSFLNFMYTETDRGFQKDFAVDKPFSSDKPGFTQNDYDKIIGIPGVKTVYRVMQKDEAVLVSDTQASDKYKQALKAMQANNLYDLDGAKYYNLQSDFYGYRDMELGLCKPNIIRGKLDTAEMNDENGILVSQTVQLNGNGVIASQLKVGDEILLVNPKAAESKPVKLKVVGILDKMPLVYSGGPEKFGIITTEEVFKRITGTDTFSRFDVELVRSADKIAVGNRLQDIAARVEEGRMLDFSSTSGRTLQMEMGVILYGLVTVISIIGALNIINTISTNLILRIREFGTLRAVGMTPGQIKLMIRMEGIFYGLIASFYGSIVGCILVRILYDNINKVSGLTWHLPWQSAAEACAVAILIGLAASAAPLKRISRMNVVDSIRAEE